MVVTTVWTAAWYDLRPSASVACTPERHGVLVTFSTTDEPVPL